MQLGYEVKGKYRTELEPPVEPGHLNCGNAEDDSRSAEAKIFEPKWLRMMMMMMTVMMMIQAR